MTSTSISNGPYSFNFKLNYFKLQASEASKATAKSSTKSKAIKNLYCSACNKLFKNIKSFENHEKSKKHKENVSNMTLDDDIGISENEEDVEDDADDVNEVKDEGDKVNGEKEGEGDHMGNSTSDIDNETCRDTPSDDSDKVQVKYLNDQVF